MRIEKDSLGTIKVQGSNYWGSQTQRAIHHFPSSPKIPLELIKAFALQKKVCALVNKKLKRLESDHCQMISKVCDEIINEKWNNEFPLSIWQSGSGTQTNMNINEVIANRCNELYHGEKGTNSPIHPNDHVNLGQSTNDSFPTAMHIATIEELHKKLLPKIEESLNIILDKVNEFSAIQKIGRTHMQDATPLTVGQEFSAFHTQISFGFEQIKLCLPNILCLAQGGTAVGTGINQIPSFDKLFAKEVSNITGFNFTSAENKFSALSSHEPLLQLFSALNLIASSYFKICNDFRLLSSGPRCGLKEYILPSNEPGSSIMPGKVNPTQVESLSMICLQIMGMFHTVSMANSSGVLQLNVYKPLIIYNIISSIDYLSGGLSNFNQFCLQGLKINTKSVKGYLENSLMLVTALTPHIGYDKSAKIAQLAQSKNISLKQACEELGFLTKEEFNNLIKGQ